MRDSYRINRYYEHTLQIKPFVGVNAPMTASVTQGVGQRFDAHFKDSDVERFLGLHVSYKDLHGIVRDGKWANHYPSLSAIPKLIDVARENRMKAIIHYNTKRPELRDELAALEEMWDRVPDGWQLNVKWPNPEEIAMYLDEDIRRADVRMIVQIGSGAYAEVGNDPRKLAEKLETYVDEASYFLFDLSGGVGKLFDPEVAIPALEAIESLAPGSAAVAGGLGPETVRLLAPLLKRFPGLSWDAQGRLRDERDRLDVDKVDAFLRESAALRT